MKFPLNGKIKFMFQTTNQISNGKPGSLDIYTLGEKCFVDLTDLTCLKHHINKSDISQQTNLEHFRNISIFSMFSPIKITFPCAFHESLDFLRAFYPLVN